MSFRLASARRIVGASAANMVYLIVQGVMFVLFTPWIVQALGPETYGIWTILVAIMGIAGLGNFGTAPAVVKYVSQFSITDETLNTLSASVTFSYLFVFVTGVATSLSLWLLREPIASAVSGQLVSSSLLADALALMAFALIPLFLSQVSKGILLGLLRNDIAGSIDVLQSALWLGGTLVIGVNGGNIVQIGAWMFAANLLAFVYAGVITAKITRSLGLHPVVNAQIAHQMLGYSVFAWLSNIGSTLFESGPRILIGALLGPIPAGAYGIAAGVGARINQLTAPFVQVLVPFSSSYQSAGRDSTVKQVFLSASRVVSCLLVAVAGTLYIWADVFLSLWLSPQFAHSYTGVFRIVILCYTIFSMATPGYQVAFGIGKTYVPAAASAVGSAATMILILLLAPPFGLTGASLATFAYLVVLWVSIKVGQYLGARPREVLFGELGPALGVLASIVIFHPFISGQAANMVFTACIVAIVAWVTMQDSRLHQLIASAQTLS